MIQLLTGSLVAHHVTQKSGRRQQEVALSDSFQIAATGKTKSSEYCLEKFVLFIAKNQNLTRNSTNHVSITWPFQELGCVGHRVRRGTPLPIDAVTFKTTRKLEWFVQAIAPDI